MLPVAPSLRGGSRNFIRGRWRFEGSADEKTPLYILLAIVVDANITVAIRDPTK